MLVRSRTMEYRSGAGPTPNVAVSAPGRVQRGTYGRQGKAAGCPNADGFAANPQMTTRRFPPPQCDLRLQERHSRRRKHPDNQKSPRDLIKLHGVVSTMPKVTNTEREVCGARGQNPH
jgi:hypothetical protein